MNSEEEHLDILQNLEFAVVQSWRSNPELNDYSVMRAYDAALAHYGSIARNQTPKPVTLTGVDAKVFEAVKETCEWRLGRVQPTKGMEEVPPVPAEVLVSCLKKLRKSVDRWNRTGGRQGYLQFVQQFVR